MRGTTCRHFENIPTLLPNNASPLKTPAFHTTGGNMPPRVMIMREGQQKGGGKRHPRERAEALLCCFEFAVFNIGANRLVIIPPWVVPML